MANVITSAEVDAFMRSPTTEEMRVCSGVSGHVATIADLKALTVGHFATGAVMEVDGYYAVGDGGGGRFCWEGGSGAPDNGGTVIRPTTGAGAWVRMVEGNIINACWFGASPTQSEAVNVTALNAAATVAGASGIFHIPPGQFPIDGMVTVLGSMQATGAVLYTAMSAGTALQIGSATVMTSKCCFLPQVVHETHVWASQVGVKVTNAYRCEFHVPLIRGFKKGLVIEGLGAGCHYNNWHIGHLYDNEHHHEFTADATGAANENVFIGGAMDYPSSRGTALAGTRCVYIPTLANAVNNNRWIGCAFEGDQPEFHAECCGYDNYFLYCRWETSSGSGVYPKVKYGGAAHSNVIMYGNYADQIVVTQDASAGTRSAIITAVTQKVSGASGLAGVGFLAYQHTSSGSPIMTLHDPGSPVAHDICSQIAATDYCAAFSSRDIRLKARADAEARIILENDTGRIFLGPGGATAPASVINESGGNLVLTPQAATNGAVSIPSADGGQRGLLIGSINPSNNFPIRLSHDANAAITIDFANPNTGALANMAIYLVCGGQQSSLTQYPTAGTWPATLLMRCQGSGGFTLYSDTGPVDFWVGGTMRFRIAGGPPASAAAAGAPGSIAWDSGFFYVCVATNTWKRTPLSSW